MNMPTVHASSGGRWMWSIGFWLMALGAFGVGVYALWSYVNLPMRTHAWPSVQYIVEISGLVVRDAKGVVLVDSRTNATTGKPGDVLWGMPRGLHTVENVGKATARVISVEIKDH